MEKIKDFTFWNWEPLKSLGPFEFGHHIDEYISKFHLINHDEYVDEVFGANDPQTRYYSDIFEDQKEFLIPKFEFDFSLYTKNDILFSIFQSMFLYYNGEDLIEQPLAKAMEIIGRIAWDSESSAEIGDDVQFMYTFYDLGLTLWTLDGIVVSAVCDDGTAYLDDD